MDFTPIVRVSSILLAFFFLHFPALICNSPWKWKPWHPSVKTSLIVTNCEFLLSSPGHWADCVSSRTETWRHHWNYMFHATERCNKTWNSFNIWYTNVNILFIPVKLVSTKAKIRRLRWLQRKPEWNRQINGHRIMKKLQMVPLIRRFSVKVASILPPSQTPFTSVQKSNETSAGFLLNYLSNGGREWHLITRPQI